MSSPTVYPKYTPRQSDTGLLHDCTPSVRSRGCDHAHEGFRYWTYHDDLDLPLAAPYLVPAQGWPGRTAIHAQCYIDDHKPPVDGCTCGIRVAPDMVSLSGVALVESRHDRARWRLLAYENRTSYEQFFTDDGVTPINVDYMVLGSVGTWGRFMHGSQEDPAGIIRVEHAVIHPDNSVLHVPSTLANKAERLQQIYGGTVEIHKTRGHPFFAEFLPVESRSICKACGATTGVVDGLCQDDWRDCCDRLAMRSNRGERL